MAYSSKVTNTIKNALDIVSKTCSCQFSAPTGFGKSTKLPLALALKGKKVFVAEPTVIGVKNLYYQIKDTITSLGLKFTVGYRAESEGNFSQDNSIVYITTGALKNQMIKYFAKGKIRNINFTDVIILDEAHNGSIDNNFILSLWRIAYLTSVKIPKLVISTATPVEISWINEKIPFEEIDKFKVTINYSDIVLNTKSGFVNFTDLKNILDKAFEITKTIISKKEEKKALLIFVPGKREIFTLKENIQNYINKGNIENVLLIAAYGGMSEQDFNLIEPIYQGTKIIISTNATETSITIKDLYYIIDTMTEKIMESFEDGSKKLTLKFASKNSAIQRAGRIGRVSDGVLYRVISENDFNNLKNERKPEIERTDLSSIIMEFINLNLNPYNTIYGLEKSKEKISNTINFLMKNKFIDTKDKEFVISNIGNFSTSFPIGIKYAASIYYYIDVQSNKKNFNLLGYVCSICIIDDYEQGFFVYPKDELKNKIEEAKNELTDKYNKEFNKNYNYLNDYLLNFYVIYLILSLLNGNFTLYPSRETNAFINKYMIDGRKIRKFFKFFKTVIETLNYKLYLTNLPKDYIQSGNNFSYFDIPDIYQITYNLLKVIFSERIAYKDSSNGKIFTLFDQDNEEKFESKNQIDFDQVIILKYFTSSKKKYITLYLDQ